MLVSAGANDESAGIGNYWDAAKDKVSGWGNSIFHRSSASKTAPTAEQASLEKQAGAEKSAGGGMSSQTGSQLAAAVVGTGLAIAQGHFAAKREDQRRKQEATTEGFQATGNAGNSMGMLEQNSLAQMARIGR